MEWLFVPILLRRPISCIVPDVDFHKHHRKGDRMGILTQAHHEHFDEYGYMVIENAVPIALCDAVVDAIFAFLEMNPSKPDDWYRAPHKPGAGMVEMYHHQAMWNVYQHPPIHQIYREVYGTERIWVHIDRVNMKPPLHPDYPNGITRVCIIGTLIPQSSRLGSAHKVSCF